MKFSRGCQLVLSLAFLLVGAYSAASQTDDSLIDAKRQMISELMRKDEFDQAAAMSRDLLATDPTHYQDHLALAHSYEKLGKEPEAIAEYQAVRDLLPPTAQNNEQRSARAEADRRIRLLDPTSEKLRVLLSDLNVKLESLEREAHDSHNEMGVAQIKQVQAQLASCTAFRTHALLPVSARANWVDTGLDVVAGEKYQIIATGIWKSSPTTPCDADGIPHLMTGNFAQGALIGSVGSAVPFLLGKKTIFVAPASGRLLLGMNDDDKADNSGSVQVYIGPPLSADGAN